MKAILFDVYGTLISTGNGSVTAAGEILRKNGCGIDPAAFYAEWKKLHKTHMREKSFVPEREIFLADLRALYTQYSIRGNAAEDVQIMLRSLYDRRAFPETAAVIQELRGKYELIIASNTDTEPMLKNFAVNGLHFDRVFTSEDLRCYKPEAAFYEKILKETGYTAEEVVFVGDSAEEDILSPKRLGMRTVLIDRKGTGADCGQTYTFSDLTGLLSVL